MLRTFGLNNAACSAYVVYFKCFLMFSVVWLCTQLMMHASVRRDHCFVTSDDIATFVSLF